MGTRIHENQGQSAEKVYAAAEQWVDRALRNDDSLFTPGVPIWSSRWLRELRQRFLDRPDDGPGKFLEKLCRQLMDSPPEVYQLMGEALYFHFLIVSRNNSTGARQTIDTVLGWSPSPVEIPPNLISGLTPGIANPGQGFHGYRPFQVGFLLEFVEQWKELGLRERRRWLNSPRDFKSMVMGLPLQSLMLRNNQNTPQIQREALLHLVFPDTFEAIVSWDHKNMIAETFAEYVAEPSEDIDHKLAQIRPALESQYGSRDHFFYATREVAGQWRGESPPPKPGPWDKFVYWAKRFYEWDQFYMAERDYKLKIGRELATVQKAFEEQSPDWDQQLEQALRHPSSNNLVDWRAIDNFMKLGQAQRGEALKGIWGIWGNPNSVSLAERAFLEDQIRHFVEMGPVEVQGRSVSFASLTSLTSLLLMADGAGDRPIYGYSTLQKAGQLTETPFDANDSRDVWERYEHMLGFYDQVIMESEVRGLELRDRLDAQALTWCVTQYGKEDLPEDWPEEVKEQFLAYQRGERAPTPLPPPPPAANPWSQENIAALADDLLWEPVYLQQIIDDLQEKRQVIFYGPPGTGKTYVAKEIAKQCRLNGGDFEIVQFHPSYSYEDFVEGIRPRLSGGQAEFELVQGPLRRIADTAKNNEGATYVLVIDELNRGNVAKVFGELYFLLEYRNEPVRLQYGREGERFSLPPNLWFICTMNTADRSIALMDAALRRRFYFAAFFPNEPPIQGLLRRWLNKRDQDTLAADLIDQANKNLDRDAGIGPSYFMRPDQILDEDSVRRIWERAVIPYVEEQCFGDDAKLQTFGFRALKREIDGSAAAVASGDSTTEQASDANPGTR